MIEKIKPKSSENLASMKPGTGGMIQSLNEEVMDKNTIQDFWDHGFLPGTRFEILGVFPSQKKILVLVEGAVKIALPMNLAEQVLVVYEK
ncbi:MAG: ferrous iron transport protein A [Leptospira sp.]|nr:ferrous iron transport protein A [Leptospira sp.]